MKVITRYRLGDMVGTLYETSLRGASYYEYRIRFHKQIIGRSYVYHKDQKDCLERMRNEMEEIFDSGRMEFIQ